ncbi:MAG: response regulator [Candidatus Omnitrophica bacterium]|nr:response regulator [Candidatus Omnitrophota bacterium]
MLKKVYDLKVIGSGLAVLYATSLVMFMRFVGVSELPSKMYIYIFLFVTLFIAALAVISLKEWGRQLIVTMNVVMFIVLLVKYIPKIDLVPFAYIFMNIIVFLYFSQSGIRMYFHDRRFRKWYSLLLIDEDENFVKAIRPVLISHGCSVLTAATGEEGLEIARTQKPDMVIMDVLLPKMKGREVCRALKADEATKGIPVVFMTAKDSEEDLRAEREAGAAAHLSKPLPAKRLISTIRMILEPR